jgi:hypothetical protein
LVTVDWDWFIWNGARDWLVAHPGTAEERRVPGMALFDWGISESHGELLAKILWATRVSGFTRAGLDIEQVISIDKSRGCTPVDEFVFELSKKFDLHRAIGHQADSHLHAYITLQTMGKSNVVNFDAHHDLGYSSRKVREERRRREFDCGSWAYHALAAKLIDEYTVVYPDWLGLKEWEEMEDGLIKRFGDRVRATTWSEWVAGERSQIPASGIHLARSSNWTPPYLDAEYLRLVSELTPHPLCYDCWEYGIEKVGAYDACKPRDWWAEARENGQKEYVETTRLLQTAAG